MMASTVYPYTVHQQIVESPSTLLSSYAYTEVIVQLLIICNTLGTPLRGIYIHSCKFDQWLLSILISKSTCGNDYLAHNCTVTVQMN